MFAEIINHSVKLSKKHFAMKYPLFFLLTLALAFTACKPDQESANQESAAAATTEQVVQGPSIKGDIYFEDENTIPSSSVVIMQLLDITDGVAKATLVKEYVFEAGKSFVPVPFHIGYKAEYIQADRKYGLIAEIKFVNSSLYYSTEPVEVLSNGQTEEVSLTLLKGAKPAQ